MNHEKDRRKNSDSSAVIHKDIQILADRLLEINQSLISLQKLVCNIAALRSLKEYEQACDVSLDDEEFIPIYPKHTVH